MFRQLQNFLASVPAIVAAIAAFLGALVLITKNVQELAGLTKRLIRPKSRSSTVTPVEVVEFTGRAGFIEAVWSQRIVNALEHSLMNVADIRLKTNHSPDLLRKSYSRSAAAPGAPLTVEFAYREGGGQLLLVGPPGSGKTTEALKQMRRLLQVARQDPEAPVPELFLLPSWTNDRKALLDWMADQLQQRHGRTLTEGRSLIWHHRIMPVLDGLDEVQSEYRQQCLDEINLFWETHRGGPLILCCRLAEYEQLADRVRFGVALKLCPLTPEQVHSYLEAAGPRWDEVRKALRTNSNPSLTALLTTPLMLSIVVLAYQFQNPSELCETRTDTQRNELWARYLIAMVAREHDQFIQDGSNAPTYTYDQALRWLSHLAHEMARAHKSEHWLHEETGRPWFRATVRVLIGTAVGICYFLLTSTLAREPDEELAFFSIAIAVIIAFTLRTAPTYRTKLDTSRRFPRLRFAMKWGLGIGSIITLFVVILTVIGESWEPSLDEHWFIYSLLMGTALGLIFALPAACLAALGSWIFKGTISIGSPDSRRVSPSSPMAITFDSGTIGLVIGVATGLVGLPIFWLGLIFSLGTFEIDSAQIGLMLGFGIALALIASLSCGLGSLLVHYANRCRLKLRDLSPLRRIRFLNWACDRMLLTSSGPTYQFVHLELRDFLSENRP